MADIWELIHRVIERPGDPVTFFELGAFNTENMNRVLNMRGRKQIQYYMFEPDPRNVEPIKRLGLPAGVTLVEAAVGDRDGFCTFYLSDLSGGGIWTQSSSIRRPKEHLNKYPGVIFKGEVQVKLMKLDSFCRQAGVHSIDFIWSDLQGAERDMVAGAHEILKNTKFLYMERDNLELYEGQWTFPEMVEAMNPQWGIVETFPEDVLFYNRNIFASSPL